MWAIESEWLEKGRPVSDRFSRTELLLGTEAMERLARAHIIVFGIGGVGGYVVEALARSGVGALTLVDGDLVAESNINRQIVATANVIGLPKVQVMARRIQLINPSCQVKAHRCFYLADTADLFDLSHYDYVVDAVDTVTAKLLIAERAQAAGTPVISSMGAGNKLDPTAFRVADIYETSVCPLAKVMRKECRKRGIDRLKVVYSQEPPVQERADVVGSVAFVPSVAGLTIASEVVKDLIGR